MNNLVRAIVEIVIAVAGATLLSYRVFVWLGKRWLEQQFAKDLERFRHEQAKEIEHVRHEINSLFSRVSKIHEREFEVLPAAWEKLHVTYGRAFQACTPLVEYRDLNRMSDGELSEFLASTTRLPEFRKAEIRQTAPQDRNNIYREAMSWVELGEARIAQNEFHNYLILNRIFMTDELWDKFSSIDTQLGKALVGFTSGKEVQDRQMMRDAFQTVSGLDAAVKEVEKAVQKRLHYEEA